MTGATVTRDTGMGKLMLYERIRIVMTEMAILFCRDMAGRFN